MSGCFCDDPDFRLSDELTANSARVRCDRCGGKVGSVSFDALNVFGITRADLEPGTTMGIKVGFAYADAPNPGYPPIPDWIHEENEGDPA